MKKGLLVSSLVAVASAASAQSLSASSVRRVAIRRIGAMEESAQKYIRSANGIIGVARLGSVVVALLNLERVSDIASPMRLLSQPQPDASRFVEVPEAVVERGF